MPLTPAEVFAALTPEEQAAMLAGTPREDPPPAPAADAATSGPFAELEDFYDLELPLKHRTRDGVVHVYVLHATDVETGLLCQRMMNTGLGVATDYRVEQRAEKLEQSSAILDDSTEEDLYRRLLGGDTGHPNYSPGRDLWRRLLDEGAPWPLVRHLGITALFWAGRDRDTALAYWLDGARPKAPAPSEPTPPTPKRPQDRRPSPREGGDGTTPRPASTNSTKPRKRAPAKRTPGKKS